MPGGHQAPAFCPHRSHSSAADAFDRVMGDGVLLAEIFEKVPLLTDG